MLPAIFAILILSQLAASEIYVGQNPQNVNAVVKDANGNLVPVTGVADEIVIVDLNYGGGQNGSGMAVDVSVSPVNVSSNGTSGYSSGDYSSSTSSPEMAGTAITPNSNSFQPWGSASNLNTSLSNQLSSQTSNAISGGTTNSVSQPPSNPLNTTNNNFASKNPFFNTFGFPIAKNATSSVSNTKKYYNFPSSSKHVVKKRHAQYDEFMPSNEPLTAFGSQNFINSFPTLGFFSNPLNDEPSSFAHPPNTWASGYPTNPSVSGWPVPSSSVAFVPNYELPTPASAPWPSAISDYGSGPGGFPDTYIPPSPPANVESPTALNLQNIAQDLFPNSVVIPVFPQNGAETYNYTIGSNGLVMNTASPSTSGYPNPQTSNPLNPSIIPSTNSTPSQTISNTFPYNPLTTTRTPNTFTPSHITPTTSRFTTSTFMIPTTSGFSSPTSGGTSSTASGTSSSPTPFNHFTPQNSPKTTTPTSFTKPTTPTSMTTAFGGTALGSGSSSGSGSGISSTGSQSSTSQKPFPPFTISTTTPVKPFNPFNPFSKSPTPTSVTTAFGDTALGTGFGSGTSSTGSQLSTTQKPTSANKNPFNPFNPFPKSTTPTSVTTAFGGTALGSSTTVSGKPFNPFNPFPKPTKPTSVTTAFGGTALGSSTTVPKKPFNPFNPFPKSTTPTSVTTAFGGSGSGADISSTGSQSSTTKKTFNPFNPFPKSTTPTSVTTAFGGTAIDGSTATSKKPLNPFNPFSKSTTPTSVTTAFGGSGSGADISSTGSQSSTTKKPFNPFNPFPKSTTPTSVTTAFGGTAIDGSTATSKKPLNPFNPFSKSTTPTSVTTAFGSSGSGADISSTGSQSSTTKKPFNPFNPFPDNPFNLPPKSTTPEKPFNLFNPFPKSTTPTSVTTAFGGSGSGADISSTGSQSSTTKKPFNPFNPFPDNPFNHPPKSTTPEKPFNPFKPFQKLTTPTSVTTAFGGSGSGADISSTGSLSSPSKKPFNPLNPFPDNPFNFAPKSTTPKPVTTAMGGSALSTTGSESSSSHNPFNFLPFPTTPKPDGFLKPFFPPKLKTTAPDTNKNNLFPEIPKFFRGFTEPFEKTANNKPSINPLTPVSQPSNKLFGLPGMGKGITGQGKQPSLPFSFIELGGSLGPVENDSYAEGNVTNTTSSVATLPSTSTPVGPPTNISSMNDFFNFLKLNHSRPLFNGSLAGPFQKMNNGFLNPKKPPLNNSWESIFNGGMLQPQKTSPLPYSNILDSIMNTSLSMFNLTNMNSSPLFNLNTSPTSDLMDSLVNISSSMFQTNGSNVLPFINMMMNSSGMVNPTDGSLTPLTNIMNNFLSEFSGNGLPENGNDSFMNTSFDGLMNMFNNPLIQENMKSLMQSILPSLLGDATDDYNEDYPEDEIYDDVTSTPSSDEDYYNPLGRLLLSGNSPSTQSSSETPDLQNVVTPNVLSGLSNMVNYFSTPNASGTNPLTLLMGSMFGKNGITPFTTPFISGGLFNPWSFMTTMNNPTLFNATAFTNNNPFSSVINLISFLNNTGLFGNLSNLTSAVEDLSSNVGQLMSSNNTNIGVIFPKIMGDFLNILNSLNSTFPTFMSNVAPKPMFNLFSPFVPPILQPTPQIHPPQLMNGNFGSSFLVIPSTDEDLPPTSLSSTTSSNFTEMDNMQNTSPTTAVPPDSASSTTTLPDSSSSTTITPDSSHSSTMSSASSSPSPGAVNQTHSSGNVTSTPLSNANETNTQNSSGINLTSTWISLIGCMLIVLGQRNFFGLI